MVLLVRLDLVDSLVPVERLDFQAEMVLKDQEVSPDLLDLGVLLDHLDLKDHKVPRDHVDLLDLQESLESLVVMASLDLLDLLE